MKLIFINMKRFFIIAGSVLLPGVAFAASVESILATIGNILGTLIPIIMTLALVGFFYGLAMYIFKADEDKEKGQQIMIWGIIALFVMVAVWGLVQVLVNTFGVGGGAAPVIPLPVTI